MYSYTGRRSSQFPIVAVAGVALAGLAAGVVVHRTLVREYGWEGALRYLWEGEAFPPAVQRQLDALNEAERGRIAQEQIINAVEEALDRARLDSVDDTPTTKMIVTKWVEYYKPANLEKALAGLSSTLDRLAAKVDSVIISQSSGGGASSRVITDIKARKKLLSKQLVLDMERCDTLMMSYQVLQE